MTLTQLKAEKSLIGTKTLNEYLRTSRTGSDIALNRKAKKEIYANIDKLISYMEDAERNDNKKVGDTLSKKGQFCYDAITTYRDEVMLVTA
jgi:hypothetical protein